MAKYLDVLYIWSILYGVQIKFRIYSRLLSVMNELNSVRHPQKA